MKENNWNLEEARADYTIKKPKKKPIKCCANCRFCEDEINTLSMNLHYICKVKDKEVGLGFFKSRLCKYFRNK